ncbi:hypothetical protein BG53_12770 [Paenibacillus darwinianus]|uniref:DUF3243 domain-containing protein n=1 Tax=Paenibacillus darwinianus TaxID=1380763 RepID=A0A9W5S4A8_9BACL|nr:DUF3243 domain-containing protein [Paenibacillus darwinianus]EXX91682.1 hypothetical protein BG52_07765 [Paenibacillus darwinianus]EXX92547.1 hypothetical protein BG53_12770 [Paenibacillus darwinianus]EXX92674.1 hypothetical protein CH50_03985 [Paenibacillus darwinianus]
MTEQQHVVEKDGAVNMGKVEQAIDKIGEDRKVEILSSFEGFKQYLGKRIEMAEKLGMSEEQMAKTAEKVADYLSSHEEPRNREEKLLQELWKAGQQEERHMLAHILVRMAQQQ